jgi:CheY-like chemotaxis protein
VEFFERLLPSLPGKQAWKKKTFICDDTALASTFTSYGEEADLIIIEAQLNWDSDRARPFYGIDVAASLRKTYLVKTPILFFSHILREDFEQLWAQDARFGLLFAEGSGFLSFPCSPEAAEQESSALTRLSDLSLRDVALKHCGLLNEWQGIAHRLGNLLGEHRLNSKEIRRIVEGWSGTITSFAPDQKENLDNLQALLGRPPGAVTSADLKKALEKLDDGLRGGPPTADGSSLPDSIIPVPNRPPKGFIKVLIADDEPQPFLINSLRSQYGYDVVGQAFKLSQAKDLLNKEKPDVVLSDYYFKESSRETELPDKLVGDRFIQYALKHPQYANTDPKKPIVLVTSKATLRTETDIRVGAINCSGANRATDPLYIHNVIWAEARKRGALHPENIRGREWTPEYGCRQRLEQIGEDLPKLIRQWEEFDAVVRDTLRLCRLLSQSAENDDPDIIRQAISVLEPFADVDNFSLGAVADIFAGIEKVHQTARMPPSSEAKQALRNILHGKLEQFSSVSNAAKFLLTTLPDVANELMTLAQYRRAGQQLASALRRYSEAEPLLPVLMLVNENVLNLLSLLPKLPSPPSALQTERAAAGSNKINIVVVEDNNFWRDVIFSAIEKTRLRLGDSFSIRNQHFNNAADALEAIPTTQKSFAIAGGAQPDTKTIAIVDICLPENSERAEGISAALAGRSDRLETPSSAHGLALIRTLSGYKDNIPLIVFSTIDSIEDRRAIGGWGVSDEDFLIKGVDDEEGLVRALIRKIEKKSKYVIEKLGDKHGNNRFRINGLLLRLPKELDKTFSAIHTLAQTTGRNEFSIAEIINARGDALSDKSKRAVQDQIYRIRQLILKTLRANRVYVNIRDLVKTTTSSGGDEFVYQINAEVTSVDDEESYETDLAIYQNEVCKVLVIEHDPQTLGHITELLEGLGYEVAHATNVEDAVRVAKEYHPHIVSLDLQLPTKRSATDDAFGGLEAWRQIRMALNDATLGVVVATAKTDKSYVVAKAAQMEIPIRNFISKREANWLNLFLKKISDERRRVFLGEITDAAQDINEPIIEIMDGSDLPKGVLILKVDGKPFKLKVSPVAKIIGMLLSSPNTLLSFKFIKRGIGSEKPVTNNDLKNWPKRIKEVIRNKWLAAQPVAEAKELTEKILESSSKGMQLNVHVIDSRAKNSKDPQVPPAFTPPGDS